MAREPRREARRRRPRAERVRRQARAHQPRRQGGQGRPPVRLCRAGDRRRPEGPGRLRPRQGARGAGGDPQGDRGRQAQRHARAAARRPHAAPRRARPPRRRQGVPARGASGHRHHRRRPDARGVRDARHAGRGGEVARLVQPLQHGARHLRRAQAPGLAAFGRGRGAASRFPRCRVRRQGADSEAATE